MPMVLHDIGRSSTNRSGNSFSARAQRIGRLTRRVKSLCYDLRFKRDGGRIFYAVDYSEIHSFVYLGANLEERGMMLNQFGLWPIASDVISKQAILSREQEQVRVALDFMLSKKFTNNLYILKPHLREFYSYYELAVAESADRRTKVHALYESMKDRYPKLLEIARNAENTSVNFNEKQDHEIKEIFSFVDEGFLELASDLVDIWSDYQKSPNPNYQRLINDASRNMRFFSDELSNELIREGASPVIKKIFDVTSDMVRQDSTKYFQRLQALRPKKEWANYNDSEALGIVKNASEILEKQGGNARLCMITRSQVLREIASEVNECEEDFPDIDREYRRPAFRGSFRHPETVFLDLLHFDEDYDKRISRLEETEAALSSLMKLVSDAERDANRTRKRGLSERLNELYNETASRWEIHVNRLLAASAINLPSWTSVESQKQNRSNVRENDINLRSVDLIQDESGKEMKDESEGILKRLWQIFKDDEFRTTILEFQVPQSQMDMSKLSAEMNVEYISSVRNSEENFLRLVLGLSVDYISCTVTPCSFLHPIACSIKFRNRKYFQIAEKLNGSLDSGKGGLPVKEAVLRLMEEIERALIENEVNDLESASEKALFVAYVLGMFGRWRHSVAQVSHASMLHNRMIKVNENVGQNTGNGHADLSAEIRYFSAIANIRLAMTTVESYLDSQEEKDQIDYEMLTDNVKEKLRKESLKYCDRAIWHMNKLGERERSTPRCKKEIATISMFAGMILDRLENCQAVQIGKKVGREIGQYLDRNKALVMLKEIDVSTLDDYKLGIDIVNNELYGMCILVGEKDTDGILKKLGELMLMYEKATTDRPLLFPEMGIWPYILDTIGEAYKTIEYRDPNSVECLISEISRAIAALLVLETPGKKYRAQQLEAMKKELKDLIITQ
ncbi:MAG: hypothetical protein IT350_09625 [Deltaproteobacteria bacterium]|nr:hypothetical protein [Deltaproteobacteria bacterium]